jgi:hypothetical protein
MNDNTHIPPKIFTSLYFTPMPIFHLSLVIFFTKNNSYNLNLPKQNWYQINFLTKA